MRPRAIALTAAVVLPVLAVAPALAQEAEAPPETEAAEPAPAPAHGEADVEPAGRAAAESARIASEGMIDTSDPPGFIAGNALRRTIDDDPYAPLGIRTGSFILLPGVDLSTGYTSNTTGTRGGGGAGFAIVAPEVLLQSDWSRHAVALSLRGSYETFADDTPDMPEAEAAADVRFDFADRWAADVHAAYHYGRESLSNPDLPRDFDRGPDVHGIVGSAALSGAAGRMLFTIETGADRTLYGAGTSGGRRVDQGDRDNTRYHGRLRLGYELAPTFQPFVEGIVSERVYDRRRDANGIRRGSHGDGIRLGVAFDRLPVSSGEVAVGYLRETFDDPSLKAISTFTVDGTLLWSPTELTEIGLDLFTAIDPTTDPDSSGAVVHDAAVTVAYAWRPNVTLGGEAGVTHERFQGTGETDRTYRVGFDATWQLNRNAEIAAGYVHEWRESSDRDNEYTADTVRIDLRLRQ